MKRTELVAMYFNSQLTAAENEVVNLQNRVRFRRIDLNDSYELQYALAKYETILQISKDVGHLLKFEEK